MSKYHAAVWLDHNEARIFHFDVEDSEKTIIHSTMPRLKLHIKVGSVGSGKHSQDSEYQQEIADGLMDAKEILVMGPGSAKLELIKYVHKHHHPIKRPLLVWKRWIIQPIGKSFILPGCISR